VYEQHYVEIEGTWHTAAEGERTECGLRIPYPGTPWTRIAPDKKVHCGVGARARHQGRQSSRKARPISKTEATPAKTKATKGK
jgi:hypothetical protein